MSVSLSLGSSSEASNTAGASGSSIPGGSVSSRSVTPSSGLDSVSLESLFDLCRDTSTLVRAMDTKLRGVEEKTQKLAATLKELNDHVRKYYKNSSVKGSKYEVSFDDLL